MTLAKRYSKEVQCDGKRRYTKADAKIVLKQTRASGMHLDYYHCPWCETWHMGNKVWQPGQDVTEKQKVQA